MFIIENKGGLVMKLYLIFKRLVDFIFAIILLIITFPIITVAAVAVKIESTGPILFKQLRPGKQGRVFKVYKFRSMRIETEKSGRTLSDMERMTKVGSILRKTSIDELPQLINIIKGDMSFIGPRPLLVQYLELYTDEQMRRHDITPGISGWAQVNGRNTISWEEKFKYDVYYVDNISLRIDLNILWLTICNIINGINVNSSENNTMPYFTGSTNSNS